MPLLLVLLLLFGCREDLTSTAPRPKDDPSQQYGRLLLRVVTDDGYVDYDRLEANRKPLDAYVSWLAGPRAWRGARPTERLVDWLNAYNALVLYQVLERGTPASVLDVPGWLPGPGTKFFSLTAFQLGLNTMSLSEIEHERIRMSEMDYRTHAAITHATRSSPPLRDELYTKQAIGRQLRDQMTRWVDDPVRGVRIEEDEVVFSAIFDSYARDFEFFSAGQDLCTLAAGYASGKKARELKRLAKTGCPHRFMEYDWALNSPP